MVAACSSDYSLFLVHVRITHVYDSAKLNVLVGFFYAQGKTAAGIHDLPSLTFVCKSKYSAATCIFNLAACDSKSSNGSGSFPLVLT